MDKYFTIYKITNLINGKFYIGKHITKDPNDNYFGSGKLIIRAIKKYGKENFSKEVICLCSGIDELNTMERYLISENLIKNPNNYNLGLGGDGGWEIVYKGEFTHFMNIPEIEQKRKNTCLERYGFDHNWKSPELREKASEKYFEKTGYYFSSQVPEIKARMIESNKNTCIERYGVSSVFQLEEFQEKRRQSGQEKYGYNYASQVPEIIEQAKITRKETCLEKYGVEHIMYLQESKDKLSKAISGKVWMCKDDKNIFIDSEESSKFLDEGYEFGMNKISTNEGKIYINDGTNNKLVFEEELPEYLDLGWFIGLTNIEERNKTLSDLYKGTIYINNGIEQKRIKPEDIQGYLDSNKDILDESYYWKCGMLLSDEQRISRSESMKGTVYINKDGICKKVKKEFLQEYLDLGWVNKRIEKPKENKCKKIWINNGIKNKLIPEDEYCFYPEWKLGSKSLSKNIS